MTPAETREILARLAAVYPQVAIVKLTADVWQEVLEGVTVEEARQAVRAYLQNKNSFFPPPGVILSIVRDARAEKRRSEMPERLSKEFGGRALVNGRTVSARELLEPETLEKLLRLRRGRGSDA